jgi:hypothetical protein
MNEIGERLFAVHEDDWDTLAVPPLEFLVSSDVDLLELERNLALYLYEDPAGSLTEVAALRVVQRQSVSGAMGRAHG